MLTDPKLRSQVDALWDKFWTGDLTIRWIRLSSLRVVVAWVEGMREMMSEAGRQVEGLFESLLAEAFA